MSKIYGNLETKNVISFDECVAIVESFGGKNVSASCDGVYLFVKAVVPPYQGSFDGSEFLRVGNNDQTVEFHFPTLMPKISEPSGRPNPEIYGDYITVNEFCGVCDKHMPEDESDALLEAHIAQYKFEEMALPKFIATQNETQSINRLFEIIEEAKSAGEYEVANAAFFVLFDEWSQDEAHKKNFTITIETDDDGGEWDMEYYDLVALRYDEHYACIPLPLLSPEQVAVAFKRGTMVDRGRHGERDYSEAAPSQVTFWILEIVGASAHVVLHDYIAKNFGNVLDANPVHAVPKADVVQAKTPLTIAAITEVPAADQLLGAKTISALRRSRFDFDADNE